MAGIEVFLAVQLLSCYSSVKFAGVNLALYVSIKCGQPTSSLVRMLNLFYLGEGAWARGKVTPILLGEC